MSARGCIFLVNNFFPSLYLYHFYCCCCSVCMCVSVYVQQQRIYKIMLLYFCCLMYFQKKKHLKKFISCLRFAKKCRFNLCWTCFLPNWKIILERIRVFDKMAKVVIFFCTHRFTSISYSIIIQIILLTA